MTLSLRYLCVVERRIISSIYTQHQTVRRNHCSQAVRDSEYKLFGHQRVVNSVCHSKAMVRNTKNILDLLRKSFTTDVRLHCKTGKSGTPHSGETTGTTQGGEITGTTQGGATQGGESQTESNREVVSTDDQDREVGRPKLEYKCIYFFPPINIIRIVQRFQLLVYSTLFPTAVAYLCTVPAASYMMMGFVVTNVMLMPLVFYMMPRMIGSMFVGGVGDVVDTLQVSRLSFFGNRKDSFYKIENVKPLSEVSHVNLVYSKFELYNKKEKLYLFHSYSQVLDKELYEIIFGRMNE
ncbi:uncharacterized protein LOC128161676 isoform X1 [Crassostrea angulata]|uniref:uncharacterized protein LOC128161676 isoform X1 n=1 Tax=Magallana angulata TaxID=2784310 RepID=UPI0022B215C4|nr:uncharacterized protein LOC128161676 isoform X1 [Crassostrea angulata]